MRDQLVAVVPARGGSKGIPGKNIRPFLGRPLLAWTLDQAREAGAFARVILSTDDHAIADVGRANGAEVPFVRPADLALDTTPTAAVVHHALAWLGAHEEWLPRFVMVLEPTSPGRQPFHIREAADLIHRSGADSLASVGELPQHHNPLKVLELHSDDRITGLKGVPIRGMIHRRQDLPRYYGFSGLIFACRSALLFEDPPTLWGDHVVGYVSDSRYETDIDTPADWVVAEARVRAILEKERAT